MIVITWLVLRKITGCNPQQWFLHISLASLARTIISVVDKIWCDWLAGLIVVLALLITMVFALWRGHFFTHTHTYPDTARGRQAPLVLFYPLFISFLSENTRFLIPLSFPTEQLNMCFYELSKKAFSYLFILPDGLGLKGALLSSLIIVICHQMINFASRKWPFIFGVYDLSLRRW